MKIRYKIVFQFSLIVALNLLIFSGFIYYREEQKRQETFRGRLSKRAITTARLLFDVKGFSPELLRIMDKTSVNRLDGEEVYIFNTKDQLVFSNAETVPKDIDVALLDRIKMQNVVEFKVNDRENLGLLFDGKYDNFIVIESGIDVDGENNLRSLRQTLLISFLLIILVVIISGMFLAGQALQPIKTINYQIGQITAQNLRKRVDKGKNKDEIAELAHNFNQMLNRLELGFEQQRSFVSHASHELRTPLAAIKSEVQLGLDEKLSSVEYEKILQNILEDTDKLISLSNSLLQMARPIDNFNLSKIESIRIEELILSLKNELQHSKPEAIIRANFVNIPPDEHLTIIKGNESLLKNAFLNLLDNAIKYSNHQPVDVLIDFDEKDCIVQIVDKGIGIPKEDLQNIFEPFYRGENAFELQGFGVGLSICQKIIDLHSGRIAVKSEPMQGSVFTISLPHLSI
ncbi:HAMP domain-containing sensor histidine kinase [Emticicia sp. BO119]|uniref:sensor histidine kinase n=1 Tax=Emticicia sp. BO119 TaxID=2757768 RepID=UPI0015F00396|nr:HAMP domain-containing sensor histidine kinase [Emticicia sp. BO119]MBA4852412.1 HAMP domain-containing histidine kinase [Emticicia sp. BO119]